MASTSESTRSDRDSSSSSEASDGTIADDEVTDSCFCFSFSGERECCITSIPKIHVSEGLPTTDTQLMQRMCLEKPLKINEGLPKGASDMISIFNGGMAEVFKRAEQVYISN